MAAIYFLFQLLLVFAFQYNSIATTSCRETQRDALLELKKGFKDPTKRLSSWVMGRDCCLWEGVHCDNKTGNIIQLELRNRAPYYQEAGDLYLLDLTPPGRLGGEISPSLIHLEQLKHLDLSGNYFSRTNIPSFIGQLKELSYLNLSRAGFGGTIPSSLGNLSSLQTLDLSNNGFYHHEPSHQWLSHLTSLKHLVMSGVTFDSNSSSSILLVLNKLPSIMEVSLSQCELESIPLSIPHLNFSFLSVLDLSENGINSSLPGWLFNLTRLEYLDLSSNNFHGRVPHNLANMSSLRTLNLAGNDLSEKTIPESIANLCNLDTLDLSLWNISRRLDEFGGVFSGCIRNSLTHLHLSSVSLTGTIPDWIGDIKNLQFFDLSNNLIHGSVPSSLARLSSLQELILVLNELNGSVSEDIGKLSELVNLNLNGNHLNAVLSEAHFAELEKLEILDLSYNSLVFNLSSDWNPPFLLKTLRISSCSVGLQFPTWLQTQYELHALDMSYAGISDTMPIWFWNLTSNLITLDLSHNQIEGMIPKTVTSANIFSVDLSANRFYGSLPEFGPLIHILDLSNNSFSGIIPSSIGENMPDIFYVSLSMNKLNGSVPSSLCQIEGMAALDLSKNHLSGELPSCWLNSSALKILDLANNNITGGIPKSICDLPSLSSLHLSNNRMSGEFPVSLRNCTGLAALDLSHNSFTGSIPTWIGESLLNLNILSLRSNNFVDQVPAEISQLKSLQILDLSSNNLSGSIPRSLGNFTAMQVVQKIGKGLANVQYYQESLLLMLKGREDEYDILILSLLKILDFSENRLSGDIPEELSSLYGLQALNISGNLLEGEIPNKLGMLQQLETLDLSRNELSGNIPSTFSNLTFLSHFNVSYNNLSGRIPSGNQMNTLTDPSIFIGNHLCGFPLSECAEDGEPSGEGDPSDEEDEEDEDGAMLWSYVGSLSGFAVGFWTFWGVLIFKKRWRYAFFYFMDDSCDKIYVIVVLSFAKMKKMMIAREVNAN